jgi:ribosomal protein L5
MRGLDITIVTHGANKNHTLALLKEFNFPFNEEKKN